MIVLAAVSVGAAMYYYPWPEFAVADDEVGAPLFESYEAKDIRGIDIIRYDSEVQNLDRIKLNRRGEKWLIPSKQNFIATETLRIGNVVNSLNDKTVYQVISENQEDHINFGVLDPTEINDDKNIASLGTKLTLTDRNNKTVADVIVGLPVKNNSNRRYVRIPGKPRVYTIDFNANLLSTEFALWLSPNILNINPEQGRQVRGIDLDSYKIDPNQEKLEKKYGYRATLVPASGRLDIQKLQIPQGDSWYTLKTTPEQIAKLTNAVRPLAFFFVDDVLRKSEDLALALSSGDQTDESVAAFKAMKSLGFLYQENSPNGSINFDAVNGLVKVRTTDGVVTSICVGRVAGANSVDQNKLNYFVMLNTSVDEQLLKKPVQPPGISESDESDERKAYLKSLKSWESNVEKASRIASEMNAIHADWYYMVSESVIKTLNPEIPLPSAPQSKSKKDPAEKTPEEPTSGTDNAPGSQSESEGKEPAKEDEGK